MKRFLLIVTFCAGVGMSHAQEIRSVKVTELEQLIQKTDRPLVINMWATWCKPCVEEIPYFLKEISLVNAQAKNAKDSIRLILVSLDGKETFPVKLKNFVKKRGYHTEVVWLDETNADYFCPKIDPKWSGAIPATLFVHPAKGYRNFIEEQLPPDVLQKEIMAMLQSD